MSARDLHDHQAKALDMLRDSLRNGKRRPILCAPCGFGKTVLAGNIINRAVKKGKKVCFVVPAISLVDQTVQSLFKDGVHDVGVIQANHFMSDWSKPVQVASIQTIAKRKKYPDADLVLVDEAHKVFKTQTDWMKHEDWLKVPFIGMSATPWTKGLGKHYDDIIISATTQELIDKGFLAPFRVFAPDHPDLSGVDTQRGDYHEGQLGDAMDKMPLVANIVETWLRQGEGRPTLAFAVNCAHAKHIQRQFEEAGIPCGYQDAHTDDATRAKIKRDFHAGALKIVANVGTLTIGVDWDVRCIILARPTKSEMLFVQIIGRGLRTAQSKLDCLVLDHSNTHQTLGFVTDIFHDTLDSGKERKASEDIKDRQPKECPQCHFLRPKGTRACPNCGHMVGVPPSEVEHVEGNLKEITPKRGTGKKDDAPTNTIRIGDKWLPLGDFYGMLCWYGVKRGYKEGWAANKYKTAVGTWPNKYKYARLIMTIPEVDSWIRSQLIGYAKAVNATSTKEEPKPVNDGVIY